MVPGINIFKAKISPNNFFPFIRTKVRPIIPLPVTVTFSICNGKVIRFHGTAHVYPALVIYQQPAGFDAGSIGLGGRFGNWLGSGGLALRGTGRGLILVYHNKHNQCQQKRSKKIPSPFKNFFILTLSSSFLFRTQFGKSIPSNHPKDKTKIFHQYPT